MANDSPIRLKRTDAWRGVAAWPVAFKTEAYVEFGQRMPRYLDAETVEDVRPITELPRTLANLAFDWRDGRKRRAVVQ